MSVYNTFTDRVAGQTTVTGSSTSQQLLQHDPLGSVRGVSTGTPGAWSHNRVDYTAFGTPFIPGTSTPIERNGEPTTVGPDPSFVPGAEGSLTSFAFTGERRDQVRQYHRARWLTPTRGSWLSQDPVFDWSGNRGHPLSYIGHKPLSGVGPSGKNQLTELVSVTQARIGLTYLRLAPHASTIVFVTLGLIFGDAVEGLSPVGRVTSATRSALTSTAIELYERRGWTLRMVQTKDFVKGVDVLFSRANSVMDEGIEYLVLEVKVSARSWFNGLLGQTRNGIQMGTSWVLNHFDDIHRGAPPSGTRYYNGFGPQEAGQIASSIRGTGQNVRRVVSGVRVTHQTRLSNTRVDASGLIHEFEVIDSLIGIESKLVEDVILNPTGSEVFRATINDLAN